MLNTDHDLLVELKTMSKLQHEENQRTVLAHIADDAKQFAEVQMKIGAAHGRMDIFKKETLDLIDDLKARIDSLNDVKSKVLGGATVVMFIITVGISILSLLKK